MLSKRTNFLIITVLILFPFSILSLGIINGPDFNLTTDVKADDVPDVDFSELPQIDYYSWANEWKDPKIEMLIIVPPNKPNWVNAVKPLANWKNEKGVKTVILNATSDNDPAEIRDMIKYYYERENIRWVLLCGDAEAGLIPIRYVYNPDNAKGDLGSNTLKPTDFYYADLTGSWDSDGDGRFGEAARYNAYGQDEISWIPEVYVGRFPANNLNELKAMVNKTLKYETNPDVGGWMHQMLLAGAISDNVATEPPDGEDETRLTQYIIDHYTKLEMNYTHLFKSETYIPPDPKFDLNDSSIVDRLNEGYSTVFFAGHGNFNTFAGVEGAGIDPPPVSYYDNGDANAASNINKTSLVYADACQTSPYDLNTHDYNIGENLIKKENAGAVGYIGGLRETWYYTDDTELEKLNRGNAKLFWKEFFQEKKFQPGRALYDSKVAYVNSDYYQNRVNPTFEEVERKNLLTYNLLGDPEVDIYTDVPYKASDPFTGNIYEGQLVTNVVRDINGKAVPYARVYLKSEDGKYNHTTYADKYGRLNYRQYPKEGVTFNVTITGHNLILSNFSFTTISDNIGPEIHDEDCDPENPSVTDNLCFTIESYDMQSGLENIFLLQSEINDDDFDDDYTYYEMFNSLQDDEDNYYEYSINKLEAGEHTFLVVARDWANNYHIYDDDDLEIVISPPLTDYMLFTMLIVVLGVVGISVFITYKGFKDYKQIILRFERDSAK